MARARIPTAGEIMQRRLHSVRSDATIEEAVRFLLAKGYAAAPVVDADEQLLGVLSEYDCIRVLREAITEGWPSGLVRDHMTTALETVAPELDILALSTRFCEGRHRRLLVVENGRLVGLIARRDLLRGLEAMEREHSQARRKTTYEMIGERHRKLD